MSSTVRAYCQARVLVSKAIRNNALPLLDGSVPCADCSGPASVWDHRDYLKPLEVVAVCQRCNIKRGKGINRDVLVVSNRVRIGPRKVHITKSAPRYKRIQLKLYELGITNEDIAREAGVTTACIGRLIRGRFKSARLSAIVNEKLGTAGAIR